MNIKRLGGNPIISASVGNDRLGEFFNSEGIKDDIQTNNAFNISENNNKSFKTNSKID